MTERVPRRRRSAEDSRNAAMDAARTLLLEQGPQSVTLQAVAASLGMTHGNIAYHFGSSDALRAALVESMIAPFLAEVPSLAARLRRGEISAADVVGMTFNAFADGGIGLLFAWMTVQGEMDRLDRVFASVTATVDRLLAVEPPRADQSQKGGGAIIAALVSAALGYALIGTRLEDATAIDRGTLQKLAAMQVEALLTQPAPRARQKAI
jgi:AcrR family transcriptional regulator